MKQQILLRLRSIFSNEFIFIIPVFLIINTVLFYKDGVKVVTDTERYIDYATNLQAGFYFDPHNFWYIGYSLYILLIQLLHGDVFWIVMGQYVLGFMAVIALYHASLYIWNNKWSATFAALFYLFFIDISSWNAYVLTESLYTSFTCFSLYLLTRVVNGKTNFGLNFLTVIIVMFTISIKPTGIALAGAVLFLLTFKMLKQLNNRVIYIISLVVIGCVFLYLVNQRLATYFIMENYQLGEVISGVTTLSDRPEVETFVLTVPENIYHPSENLPPLLKIILFFFHHPIYWLKLFFVKAFYLLFHVRPFWSLFHNMLSLVILIPAYWFCLKVLLKEKIKSDITNFSAIYLLIHFLSVCMTSEDWDGRFLIPMLPVVFIFTGHGITLWLKKQRDYDLIAT